MTTIHALKNGNSNCRWQEFLIVAGQARVDNDPGNFIFRHMAPFLSSAILPHAKAQSRQGTIAIVAESFAALRLCVRQTLPICSGEAHFNECHDQRGFFALPPGKHQGVKYLFSQPPRVPVGCVRVPALEGIADVSPFQPSLTVFVSQAMHSSARASQILLP